MKTINGMKVVRAVTPQYQDLVIVGTEQQILMHLLHVTYNHVEVCNWFNTTERDVQSKVLVAIDKNELQRTLVHNMRDDFKGILKQYGLLKKSFNCRSNVRMVDVLYLPELEVTDQELSELLELATGSKPEQLQADEEWHELLELATGSKPEQSQADQIKTFRKKYKISQTKFAEMVRNQIPILKIYQTTVSKIERNKISLNEYDWKVVQSLIASYTPE